MKLLKFGTFTYAIMFLGLFSHGQDKALAGSVLYTSGLAGINGRNVFLSEVRIVNKSMLPIDVVSLNVEADNGLILYHVSGKALQKLTNNEKNTLAIGDSTIFYLDIPWDKPEDGQHFRYVFTYNAGQHQDRQLIIEASFKEKEPIVLSAPLKGKYWTAIYSSEWQRGHRRVYYTINGASKIPGRFAIDFVRLADNGMLYRNDADSIRNYYSYGEEVLAVADATVVSLKNDFEEGETISGQFRQDGSNGSGNYLVLQVRKNVFVFYEHLQPGSIGVKVGDKVIKGQVVSKVGFTGDASEPHLHLHVADNSSVLDAEGLPFVFEKFTYQGIFIDFKNFGKLRWSSLNNLDLKGNLPGRPLPNSVITFAD